MLNLMLKLMWESMWELMLKLMLECKNLTIQKFKLMLNWILKC